MELTCSFMTNQDELAAIWEGGCALYAHLCDREEELLENTNALPAFIKVHLCLTADVDYATSLLERAYERYEKDLSASQKEQVRALQYASALETYATYVQDPERIKPLLALAERLFSAVDEQGGGSFAVQGHLLGASLALERVRAICDLPISKIAYGRRSEAYHKAYYRSREGIYRAGDEALLPNVHAAYYGFVSDDCYESVRDLLIAHSFEVPRCARGWLLMALYHLEAYDALFPALLECGSPTPDGEPEGLWLLAALLTLLCGVNLEMLGKGIHMADPHLPDYVGYRLVLPSPGGYLPFDGGEDIHDFLG